MRHNNREDGAMTLLRALAELGAGLWLLLRLGTLAWVRGGGRPGGRAARHAHRAPQGVHAALPSALPLQWRGPWQAWQLLSWALGTLLAPGFWFVGSLLLVNAHCDHPLFWFSLPAIVLIGNAVAIVHTNQQHHRMAFGRRTTLALRHAVAGMVTGSLLFLLAGWGSGFLPDAVAPMSGAAPGAFQGMATALWSLASAAAFGFLSFAHAGVLHAWLGFRSCTQRAGRDFHGALAHPQQTHPAG